MSDPISRWRYAHLLSRAKPHLGSPEAVICWARIRDPERRRRGIAYLGERACLIQWTTGQDEYVLVPWSEMRTWGITQDQPGGPLLCLQTSDRTVVVSLPATTSRMAENVARFLAAFGEHAPWPEKDPDEVPVEGSFEPRADVSVARERLSLGGQTKRIAITVVGMCVLALGLILIPLPGPGLLVAIAGLAILSTEFDFATDALDWARQRYRETKRKISERSRER